MSIAELHNKAMELADLGDISKLKHLPEESSRYYNEAFEIARQAAHEAVKSNVQEPSLSILLRSAASLALCSMRLREAEQLIALALSGEPPFEIAEELRNLLETVNFERHLEVNGVSLQDGEVQLVVAGNGVGYGFAKGDDFLSRVDKFTNLATRTIERRLKIPFRKSGPMSVKVKKMSETYLSLPRAASFAVTLRFGSLPGQTSLSGFDSPASPYNDIIDDIAKNISLINDGKTEELESNFNDKTYLNNFISLAKELAPDGKNISLFGITYKKTGDSSPIPIKLTRTRDEFNSFPSFEVPDENDGNGSYEFNTETINGVLSVANGPKGSVKIITGKSKDVTLSVPDGLSDIVKTYWEEKVTVTYKDITKPTKQKVLLTIDKWIE
jgi:hypothetical protein